MKAVICTPTRDKPHPAYIDSLEASIPALDEAGIEHKFVQEIGSPYISCARASILRKALDTEPDCVVFIDDDVSWRPQDLVNLIKADADVVAGLYCFKLPGKEEYMGELLTDAVGNCRVRHDGLIYATKVPAGFLKVTTVAIDKMMKAHPELVFGRPHRPHFDLFNHGAHEGLWWGEDYAFSRRWCAMGEYLFVLPDLDLGHHGSDGVWMGNFHDFMMRQPGGALDPAKQ